MSLQQPIKKQAVSKPKVKKVASKPTHFYLKVRSRHPSHDTLRQEILLPFKALIRFGSTTTAREIYPKTIDMSTVIEINSIDSIETSSNKLLMKQAFAKVGVITPAWCKGNILEEFIRDEKLKFPIVAKGLYGSRGETNSLIEDNDGLINFLRTHTRDNYIYEQFHNYAREYRLHVTEDGCFYTCRKMLKEDTAETERWRRHDDNSVWILETNEAFDKPSNWKEIEAECVKALKSVGLDVCSCDVKVSTNPDKKTGKHKFVILETNSASSLGDITFEKYKQQLPILATKKHVKHTKLN